MVTSENSPLFASIVNEPNKTVNGKIIIKKPVPTQQLDQKPKKIF